MAINSDHENEYELQYRILVLGETGVGKSSLISMLTTQEAVAPGGEIEDFLRAQVGGVGDILWFSGVVRVPSPFSSSFLSHASTNLAVCVCVCVCVCWLVICIQKTSKHTHTQARTKTRKHHTSCSTHSFTHICCTFPSGTARFVVHP
jgi:septin family protein